MAEHSQPAVLMPIGFPVGTVWPSNGANGPPEAGVRMGGRPWLLEADEFRLWLSAGGRTEPELLAIMAGVGFADASDRLSDLKAQNLVEQWDTTSAPPDRPRHLRIIPSGVGLGNSPEQPESFSIADSTLNERVAVAAPVYAVWTRSVDAATMGEACSAVAADCVPRAAFVRGQPERERGVPVDVILKQVYAALPALLATHVAFLDRV